MQKLQPYALALVIGLAGSLVFVWLNMPLPWMLGAIFATAVASLLHAPVKGPVKLRGATALVLGSLIGTAFTPDLLGILPSLAVSMLLMPVFLLCVIFATYNYLRWRGDDPVTAFCGGAPAGLNDMVYFCDAMGGNTTRAAILHVIRIFLVVMFLPLFMRFYADADLSASALRTASITDLSLTNVVVLIAVAIVGYYFGKLVRLPAPVLTGPMIVSAFVHITGLHTSVQPWEPLAIAQWVIGSIVGCRFADVDRKFLRDGMIDGLVSVLIMLGISFAFAFGLHVFADLNLLGMLLAYAPGGFVEMALVALATGMEVAVVSIHHLSRILWITIPGPILFRRFHAKNSAE